MSPLRDAFASIAEHFGAAQPQIARDHVISHLLAAIAQHVSTDDLVFFGGTALSRTYLPSGRLSEDVDLFTLGRHSDVVQQIEEAARAGLQRRFGRVTWTPSLGAGPGAAISNLRVADVSVRVQLLGGGGYTWPTLVQDIEQRYPDVPPTTMRTFTADAFAGAKLDAWSSRRAARDLWDLAHLAGAGLIDEVAARTVRPPDTPSAHRC